MGDSRVYPHPSDSDWLTYKQTATTSQGSQNPHSWAMTLYTSHKRCTMINLPTKLLLYVLKLTFHVKYFLNLKIGLQCLRYNKLLTVIKTSLRDLLKALKGLVVMSQALENVANSLFNNQVPAMWAGKVTNFTFIHKCLQLQCVQVTVVYARWHCLACRSRFTSVGHIWLISVFILVPLHKMCP